MLLRDDPIVNVDAQYGRSRNMTTLRRLAAVPLMLLCGGAWAPGDEPAPTERGVAQLLAFERLPFLKSDVKVEYLGSMDKTGGNWDNWWELYTDANGEHVIFEAEGPGASTAFFRFSPMIRSSSSTSTARRNRGPC